eukprot:TRINITY_DN83889_c0_g1_i1.p1 TRINITY_DN83889_c0_g1~~TRINITY_DN83889_c0_g1_i1.p1  ORF type:complete len:214 (-),score=38.89 TRINITY_DN83889_c0_g1_i1:45-686(-)
MLPFFNCCSGVQDEQKEAAKEVVDDPRAQKAVASGDAAGSNGTKPPAKAPVSMVEPAEDQNETAKHRLQRLIRDFAHDAVGPGLPMQAQSTQLPDSEIPQEATLRMDRRLSQVEVWKAGAGTAALIIPLQEVESIVKGFTVDGVAESARPGGSPGGDGISSLTMLRKGLPELRITFDSAISRDRAYTCLRIFQMSVDQTGSGGTTSPRSPRSD